MKKNFSNVMIGILVVLAVFTIIINLGFLLKPISSQLSSWISTTKGSLIGNSYSIMAYDDFGTQVMTAAGRKVDLETEKDTSGNDSSYLTITIDGYEWSHVGNTLVFIEDGADLVTDFTDENIKVWSGTDSAGLMEVDRYINHFRNIIGQKTMVVIYSQAGVPICILQGDKCYKEIPDDLPTMTRLNIDGKTVYVYRANIDIIPMDIIE